MDFVTPDERQPGENVPILRWINGLPIPNITALETEKIIETMRYRPRDGDILLCSFPKTGSTWVMYMIWQILHKGATYPPISELMFHLSPFMGMIGPDGLDKLPEPRFYKNHFQYDHMNINKKAKYIYTVRNPKDTIASLYHFQNALSGVSMEFDEFFENFMAGKVYFGNFFDHMLSYYYRKDDGNVLLLYYEDMLKDPRSEGVLKIAKFLGENYYNTLLEDKTLVQKILEVTSFDYMKKNLDFTLKDKQNISFFRKGKSGDGKALLNKKQTERLEKRLEEKMKGTELLDRWRS